MTVPQISLRNLQRRIPIDLTRLRSFAAIAAQDCLRLRKGKQTDLREVRQIFILLISDRRMSRLHLQFVGERGPTDVLTFQHGEIFISVDTAKTNARVFGNSLIRELELYIVHGLLHLHGFDDQTPAEAQKMKSVQERILRRAL